MSRLKMHVDVNDLLLQAAKEMQSFQVGMGFQIISNCLTKIAKRAIEIDDPILIDICDTLDLITISETYKETLNKRLKELEEKLEAKCPAGN